MKKIMNKGQVANCIIEFLAQPRIKSVITTIMDCNISGWEGWLQVEFAHYLQTEVYKNDESCEWYREYKVKSKSNVDDKEGFIIPDFWIKSTECNSEHESYYLIEFKRDNSGKMLDGIKKDIEKWTTHIEHSGDELKCPDHADSINTGVFFIGIDKSGIVFDDTIDKAKMIEQIPSIQTFSTLIYFLNPEDVPSKKLSDK